MKKLMFWYRSHFTHSPARDGIFYGLLLLVLVAYGIIAVASPLLMPVCEKESPDLPFRNPDFNPDPCLTTRFLALGGLTIRECEFVKNTLMAVFLGSVIGYERRGPDRAAGIRSMSLTALGACCFTIGGNFACQTGPMSWDSSRISASIPSGKTPGGLPRTQAIPRGTCVLCPPPPHWPSPFFCHLSLRLKRMELIAPAVPLPDMALLCRQASASWGQGSSGRVL